MKCNAKLRLQTLAVCSIFSLLFALIFSGCVSRSQPIDPVVEPPIEYTTIPVKMRPQEQIEFPVGGLETSSVSSGFALPSALQSMLPPSKAVSFDVLDLDKVGSAFNPALPLNNVDPAGAVAKFMPTWDAGNQTLADVAYCTYSFPLLDFGVSTQEQTLGLVWDNIQSPASYMDVFIGFGNIAEDTWDWYQGPDDEVITIDSFVPYENATGNVMILIALLNRGEFLLTSLTVGELEFRGLGAYNLGFLTEAQLIPNFWQLLEPFGTVDLSADCSPINDQGAIWSCTAFAIGDSAFNYELGQIYGSYGWDFSDPFNLVSPRQMYVQTGIEYDGTCPGGGRDNWFVAEWLMNSGVSTELNTPYGSKSASMFNCTPGWSAEAMADAALLKIYGRVSISTWDADVERYHLTDSDIDDVKTVLREQRRVVPMGTILDSNFSSPDYANKEAWTFNGTATGGHAMCIVGYDDSIGATGAFKVRNSWGVNWGDNGYCWITYESFKDSRAWPMALYIMADCDPDAVARFRPDSPLGIFAPCGMLIPIFYPTKILFEWDPVQDAVRYRIYRDTRNEPIGFVTAPTGPEKPFFEDSEIFDNLAHVYWVQATDGNEFSEFSSPIVGWLVEEI